MTPRLIAGDPGPGQRTSMKLKTKVVALSLLTLLLPWSGWNLLQELERYLRETQETALLASARIMAGSMPLEFQTRLLFAPDRYVLLREMVRQPSLDGYADDWPSAEQTQEFGFVGGRHGGPLAGRLTTRDVFTCCSTSRRRAATAVPARGRAARHDATDAQSTWAEPLHDPTGRARAPATSRCGRRRRRVGPGRGILAGYAGRLPA